MTLRQVLYLIPRRAVTCDSQVALETQCLEAEGVTVCQMQVGRSDGAVSTASSVNAWALRNNVRAWALCLATACSLVRGLGVAHALSSFVQALQVGRELTRRRITHIHAAFRDEAPWVALIAASGFDAKVSVSVSAAEDLAGCSAEQLTRAIRDVDSMVCQSASLRERLMHGVDEQYWPRIHVVRLGLDTRLFCPTGERRSRDAPVILTVGDLVPDNGHHLLIEALAKLRTRMGDVRLVIAGRGPLEGFLRRRAHDLGLARSVTVTSAEPAASLLELMRSARVYATAQVPGELPLPLARAMACGLPCVCSNVAGIDEILTDGVHGRLYIPGDVDSLADTLQDVLQSCHVGMNLGRAARYRIKHLYDNERNGRLLFQALTQVSDEQQPQRWQRRPVGKRTRRSSPNRTDRSTHALDLQSNDTHLGATARAQALGGLTIVGPSQTLRVIRARASMLEAPCALPEVRNVPQTLVRSRHKPLHTGRSPQ
jgi:colanic acid/amylovoran biosynthesis glycosyltransferase